MTENERTTEVLAKEEIPAAETNEETQGEEKKTPGDVIGAYIGMFLLGAFLTFLVFMGIGEWEKQNANPAKEYLIGTWILPADNESDSPETFAFYEDYVDVEVEDGKMVRCQYEAITNEAGDKIVTIYNLQGKDVVVSYTEQHVLHLQEGIKASYYSPN